MNALIPALAALLQSASFTMDKAVLRLRRVDWRTYTTVSFPLLFFFDAVMFIAFRPPLSWELFAGTIGLFVLATVAISFVTNALYYRALDADYLHELLPWSVVFHIPTLLVTSLLFADERRWAVLIPALVASVAAVWTSMENGSLKIHRKALPFIGWMLVSAPVGTALVKVVLETWHPITLEFVRDGLLAAAFMAFYSHRVQVLGPRAWRFLLATNALSAVAWVLFYTSYQEFGVVFTLLLFSLQPLLTYFMSALFLKEPVTRRKFVGFLIIVASIAAAQVLSGT